MRTINLFKKLQKKSKILELYSVSEGNLIPITEVNDDVFSQKMLGDGFAVQPKNSNVYSPIEGEVTSIFPTKHAIGLKSRTGVEILVHIGIDTVELSGEPFEVFVREGDKVDNKTLLATVNLKMLEEKNKQSDILVIITNDSYEKLNINDYGQMKENIFIGNLILK